MLFGCHHSLWGASCKVWGTSKLLFGPYWPWQGARYKVWVARCEHIAFWSPPTMVRYKVQGVSCKAWGVSKLFLGKNRLHPELIDSSESAMVLTYDNPSLPQHKLAWNWHGKSAFGIELFFTHLPCHCMYLKNMHIYPNCTTACTEFVTLIHVGIHLCVCHLKSKCESRRNVVCYIYLRYNDFSPFWEAGSVQKAKVLEMRKANILINFVWKTFLIGDGNGWRDFQKYKWWFTGKWFRLMRHTNTPNEAWKSKIFVKSVDLKHSWHLLQVLCDKTSVIGLELIRPLILELPGPLERLLWQV